MVSAVVWQAPLTMPSAIPRASIMVANMLGLFFSSRRAASIVTPFDLRRSARSAAISSRPS